MDVQTFNELVDVGCEKLGTRWRFKLNYLLLTIKINGIKYFNRE